MSYDNPTLKEKLDVIWNGWRRAPLRYVPKSNGKAPGAWDVWDRKEQRFVGRKELKKMTAAQVVEHLDN